LITVNAQLHDKMEELEETNADLANLIDSTDTATVFIDADSHIRHFTPAAVRLFHLITTDVGRPIGDITQKFLDDRLAVDCEQVLRNAMSLEKEVRTTKGIWHIRRITPYRTPHNRIDGVVITFAEITQLKQAELVLRQNKELQRLAAVLMDSNDAVTVQDFTGAIIDWNRGAEEMYGYTRDEALGRHVREIIPESRLAQELGVFDKLCRGERIQSWETQRLAKDGKIHEVWITATVLKNEAGEPIAIGTTERDISARKQLEKEVVEIAVLEQRRIGHELHDSTGQELAGLGLMAKSLAETLKADASPEAELATKIAEVAKRALGQVRTLSRGLIPVEVDPEGLSSALRDLAARICELHSVKCTFEQEGLVHFSDSQRAGQLYRITQEAITNALKHGHAKHIAISLRLHSGRVALRIQDDGAGISEEREEGTGMGMRIMRYRADLMNAKLLIGPAAGGGTLVTCTLIAGDDYVKGQVADPQTDR